MGNGKYVLGLDFGTDSVRTVIVHTESGKEEASEVVYYPRWTEGKYCDPAKNQFRQSSTGFSFGSGKARARLHCE